MTSERLASRLWDWNLYLRAPRAALSVVRTLGIPTVGLELHIQRRSGLYCIRQNAWHPDCGIGTLMSDEMWALQRSVRTLGIPTVGLERQYTARQAASVLRQNAWHPDCGIGTNRISLKSAGIMGSERLASRLWDWNNTAANPTSQKETSERLASRLWDWNHRIRAFLQKLSGVRTLGIPTVGLEHQMQQQKVSFPPPSERLASRLWDWNSSMRGNFERGFGSERLASRLWDWNRRLSLWQRERSSVRTLGIPTVGLEPA